MAKFQDPDTQEIIDIPTYIMGMVGGQPIYKGKNGKQLVNTNNVPLVYVSEERAFDLDNMPTLLGFAMKTREDKKKILQKRAKDHFNKEVKEVKMNLDGKTGAQF